MNITVARRAVSKSRVSADVTKVEYLRKGYSTDKKYVLWVHAQPAYLLRLSPIAEAGQKRSDFVLVGNLHKHGVACPEPVEFGSRESDGVCFSIFRYIQGDCAETALRRLPKTRQYSAGLQAGRELRLMHTSVDPPSGIDWVRIRTDKHFANKTYVREHDLVFDQQEQMEDFVEENLSLLQNRPLTFLHGDYHPGNMILREGGYAGTVDFNRCRWGDPYFEFYKVSQFAAPLSSAFATGQIRGYFGGELPEDFWHLYNFYLAMVLNADLVWTHRCFPRALPRSLQAISRILRTHDILGGGVPRWYQPA